MGRFTANAGVTTLVTPGKTLFTAGVVHFDVMPPERTTLSAQVDSDTELAKQFKKYREQNGMTSKSEAVRHLVRSGLEHELQQLDDPDDGDSARSRSDFADVDDAQSISDDFIRGNEPIIIGFAFLVGFGEILTGMTTVAGQLGVWLFIALGLLLAAWVLADVIRHAGVLRSRSDDRSDDAATARAD